MPDKIMPRLKSRSASARFCLPNSYAYIIAKPSVIKNEMKARKLLNGKIKVIAATASAPTNCPATTLSVNIKMYDAVIVTTDAINTPLNRVEITVRFTSNIIAPAHCFSTSFSVVINC